MNLRSSRLTRKLYLMVSGVLLVVFGMIFLLNNEFLSTYYLHKLKENVERVYQEVEQIPIEALGDQKADIEGNYNVTIILTSKSGDINHFNDVLREQLAKEKITLNKFWVTEEVLKQIEQGEYVNRLYNQGKLKASYLIRLFEKEGKIILIGTTVVHTQDTVAMMNRFMLFSLGGALIVGLILVWFFARRIIQPLDNLNELAKEIAKLHFKKVEVKTGDEIEELAESINNMSQSLQDAHSRLQEKNKQLKTLISSISHEMKTPLSLIKAYAIGIQDGLDNGKYVDIILEQVDYSTEMVDRLLRLSKIQREEKRQEVVQLTKLFGEVIQKYEIQLDNKGIHLEIVNEVAQNDLVTANRDELVMVLDNLISNGIKYNEGKNLRAEFYRGANQQLEFTLSNSSTKVQQEDLEHLWEPFYVVEESRNRELSGTGIGLSIVASVLDKHQIYYEAVLEKEEITIRLRFPFIKG